LTLLVVFCLSILFGKAHAAERDSSGQGDYLINPFARGRGIDISFQPSIEKLGLEIN